MSRSLIEQVNMELATLGKTLKQAESKWQDADESADYAHREYEQKKVYADKLWEEREVIANRIQELEKHLEGE